MQLEPRNQYLFGGIAKSVKKAVKGVAGGIKDLVSSDVGKMALLAAGGYYLGGGNLFGLQRATPLGKFAFSQLPGASLFTGATKAAPGVIARGPAELGLTTRGLSGLAKGALGLTGSALIGSLFGGDMQQAQEMYQRNPDVIRQYLRQYYENINPDADPMQVDRFVEGQLSEYAAKQDLADGGRVGFAQGKSYKFMELIDKEGEDEYYTKKAEELDRKYNPERYKQILPKEKPMDKYMLDEVMSERGMRTLSEGTRDDVMKMYAERAYKKGQISEDEYREIMGFKVGGRVGYAFGSYYNEPGISERLIKDIDPEDLREMSPEELEKLKDKKDKEGITSLDNEMLMADAPGITFTKDEKSYLFRTLAGQGGSDRSFTMPQLYGILNNPNSDKNIGDAKALKAFLKMKGFKTGGRVKYAMGSEVPLRDNGMGVTEMDFRETGGFVPPIGVKEKADDIPAMLSNNEFVFTADAVRAAGGGSVNKGAQKMYALMKQLEGKIV